MSKRDVIAKFGGLRALGADLGLSFSTVQHWERRGIPFKYHLPIFDLAARRGIPIGVDELLSTTSRKLGTSRTFPSQAAPDKS